MSEPSSRDLPSQPPSVADGSELPNAPPGRPCARNSSITRVRPFFRALFAADQTGRDWLPNLLRCATENWDHAEHLAQEPGRLLPETLATRPYPDDCWERSINLEACFEAPGLPPERLLLWLIDNPATLDRTGLRGVQGSETARWRGMLLGGDVNSVQTAQAEARRQLTRYGVNGSLGRWWAFEGETVVDCALETERLVLFIEGKRTERLSARTTWMPIRNQLWRNLDAAANAAAAQGKRFAVLLLAENCEPVGDFDASLPHLTASERQFLRGHNLGCVTWQAACEATGAPYDSLPDTIEDAEP